MTPRRWTADELADLSTEARRKLRDQLLAQMSDARQHVREAAAQVLALLARVGGITASDQAPGTPPRVPRAAEPRTVQQRVDDAKAALYGDVERGGYEDPAGRSVQQRVEDARAFLRPAAAGTVRPR